MVYANRNSPLSYQSAELELALTGTSLEYSLIATKVIETGTPCAMEFLEVLSELGVEL